MRSNVLKRCSNAARRRQYAQIVVLLTCCACVRPEPAIDLPAAPLLSSRNDYALVVAPLARVFAEPSYDADVVGHLASGAIVDVVASGAAGRWIHIRSDVTTGWIAADISMVFDRLGAARDAAARSTVRDDPTAPPAAPAAQP